MRMIQKERNKQGLSESVCLHASFLFIVHFDLASCCRFLKKVCQNVCPNYDTIIVHMIAMLLNYPNIFYTELGSLKLQ